MSKKDKLYEKFLEFSEKAKGVRYRIEEVRKGAIERIRTLQERAQKLDLLAGKIWREYEVYPKVELGKPSIQMLPSVRSKNLFNDLIKIADEYDNMGLYEKAAEIDRRIKDENAK